MSRVGQKPVEIPSGVEVAINANRVSAKGPLGELSYDLVDEVSASLDDGSVVIAPADESKRARAMWGTTRARVQALVTGVSEGFRKELEIIGVGYRAAVQGGTLTLQLGYSHDINYPIPSGITIKCAKPTSIEIAGSNKQQVGQVAAEIRGYRPPEPYKGKGVKYVEETILRKEGKKK